LKNALLTYEIGLAKNSMIFLFLSAIIMFLYLASRVEPIKSANERSFTAYGIGLLIIFAFSPDDGTFKDSILLIFKLWIFQICDVNDFNVFIS